MFLEESDVIASSLSLRISYPSPYPEFIAQVIIYSTQLKLIRSFIKIVTVSRISNDAASYDQVYQPNESVHCHPRPFDAESN